MLEIKVLTKDNDLIDFLNMIGTRKTENSYEFYDKDFLIENLSDYIYLDMKKEIIYNLTEDSTNSPFIEEFYNSYPLEKRELFKMKIHTVLLDLIADTSTLEMEALKIFRFRKIKNEMNESISNHLENFIRDSKYNKDIISLKKEMEEAASINKVDLMKIRTFKSNKIGLFSKTEELVSIEDKEEQYNIIIKSILLAPQKLIVEDESNVLSKETIIILKQLFEEKVSFV